MANVPHESQTDPLIREYAWLRNGKILDRAFATAEAVAHRLGADQVRVDVFVSKDPEQMPIVNEISLSSGHYYRYHTTFIAQEWADGHRIRDSKPYGGPIPVPESMLKGSRHYAAALTQALKHKEL
jgi:broad specificity phosphatase PhoE